jgi:RNA polymerase sigma-70 factor (ECF subfamily)
MTDERILRRLKNRDQEALETLMQKYHRYVYTIIANVLGRSGTAADAEELTQDTFYALWDHAAGIGSGKLKAYLATTARNRAKSHLRSQRELPMDLDTVEIPDSNSLEDQVMQEELRRRVQQAIGRMRPKDREIFLRYYYYLETTDEIAQKMHLSGSAVRSRLTRGRKTLKTILSKEVSS